MSATPTEEVSSPAKEVRAHAQFHAHESASGIGAGVARVSLAAGRHVWECIVTDGRNWHYVLVVGVDLPPFPNISAEQVEEGLERFAAKLPAWERLRHLLNENPLHIDAHTTVSE